MSLHRSADRWLALALFAGVVAFVVSLPNNLGESDESLILYEATRILRGEVLYRDVFEIITPGSLWVFAALFHVFGTTLTVARAAMAVVHALIVLLVYATCRGLGVRRGLAAAAGLTHLAIGQPVWPYGSPHWMGTLLQVVLVWLAAARPLRGRLATAVALGLAVGTLIMVQQHKGAVMALGVGLLLAADAVADRRLGGAGDWRALLTSELACAATALVVVVVPMGVVVARAGVDAVVLALVHYPLHNYPAVVGAPWGEVNCLNAPLAPYTLPGLLRWLPGVLLLTAARVVWAWRRRDSGLRGSVAVLVLGGASIVSIIYSPDFIHLAFIAPVMLIAAALALDDCFVALAQRRWEPAASFAISVLLLSALATQLTRNWQRVWTEYPTPYLTPFGRVDLRDAEMVRQFDVVRRLAAASPTREALAYPGLPMVYLVTGTDNPTPFQLLGPAYNGLPTVQAAIDTLERRRVPLVLIVEPFVQPDDPMVRYVREHYDRVGDSSVYRRHEAP